MKALEAAEKPVMGSEARCSFQIFLQHFCLTCLILTVCHWEIGGDGGVYSFWAGWLNQRGVAPRYLKLCHNRQRSLFLTGVQRWLWNLEWSRGHSVMGETMWKESGMMMMGIRENPVSPDTGSSSLFSILPAPATWLEPRENHWSRTTHLCLARFLTQKPRHIVKGLLF